MNLDFTFLLPFAVMVSLEAGITLLLTNNWRIYLFALALQYLGVFGLVATQWALGLAAVKLVVGWMTVAILGAMQPDVDFVLPFSSSRTGLIYRFITILTVGLLTNVFAGYFATWLGIEPILATSGLLLLVGGILQIGFSGSLLRRAGGILSVMCGFEIIFSPLSDSVLLAGLIALIHLGIGMAVTYWINLDESVEETV